MRFNTKSTARSAQSGIVIAKLVVERMLRPLQRPPESLAAISIGLAVSRRSPLSNHRRERSASSARIVDPISSRPGIMKTTSFFESAASTTTRVPGQSSISGRKKRHPGSISQRISLRFHAVSQAGSRPAPDHQSTVRFLFCVCVRPSSFRDRFAAQRATRGPRIGVPDADLPPHRFDFWTGHGGHGRGRHFFESNTQGVMRGNRARLQLQR